MSVSSFQDKIIEELHKRISASDALGAEDKEAWFSRTGLLLPEAALFFLQTFDEDPEIISRINDDTKEKEGILRKGDKNAWNVMLQKEKRYIESLLEAQKI